MELKQIKELMASMGRTGTKRLKLKKDNFELVLEREERVDGRFYDASVDFNEDALKFQPSFSRADQTLSRGSEMPAARGSSSLSDSAKSDSSLYVTSPMVGTFYISPSPDDPSFVKVGDKIERNTVVCIIEAMKVMNEIKANVNGVVAEVLVETGQPVEFGTKLFRIIE